MGTIYYIDLDNGNDARTGLKIGPSTIDSTADTTHFVDDFLTGADDYINGSFVWNVTRSAGSLITDFVADTDTVTLADAIPGMTAGDTYYILDAWLTIDKYTSVTPRTPGDIAKIRANTSQTVTADIDIDDDGTKNDYIEIRGCSSTDDPWGDSSDVKPIFDFNNAAYQIKIPGLNGNYWRYYNLELRNSTDTSSSLYPGSWGSDWIIEDCKFYNNKVGISLYRGDSYLIKDCIFDANTDSGIKIAGQLSLYRIAIKGCTFDGGTYGIESGAYRGRYVIIDCSFGQTTPISSYDIDLAQESEIFFRNCKWDKGIDSSSTPKIKKLHYEDDDGTFEVHKFECYEGTIERDTVVTRPGGADSSAKMTPSAYVALYHPLTLSGEIKGISPSEAFRIWLNADEEKTINIYIKGFGWTGFPTASQLFIRAEYYGNAGNCIRTELDSDETISDNTTWVPFQVTLTPARTGFVYVDVFVSHYEASSGVNVDTDTSNIT